jgi:PPM family protein phosphatase
MIGEDQVLDVLDSTSTLNEAAERLIGEANEAGGRDNITVVLFRLEEVGEDSDHEEPTVVGLQPAQGSAPAGAGTAIAPSAMLTLPSAAPSGSRARVPLARRQGKPVPAKGSGSRRRPARYLKLFAALISIVAVLFLVGGGGYLASRQLFFIGTDPQGIVTIYRGLPYNLPGGLHMYETFYVSGVPASLVPADRRGRLFDHQIRSQSDASNLVRELELGQLAK